MDRSDLTLGLSPVKEQEEMHRAFLTCLSRVTEPQPGPLGSCLFVESCAFGSGFFENALLVVTPELISDRPNTVVS